MGLEAVMIVVDNSEFSRNGDYPPTRFDAQADAVNVLFQHIINGNPESAVGLMSMGGKGPEMLVTPTTEQGKILEGLHRTKKNIGGSCHLATGIQVAGLALKHRQNKSQRPRIILFICSPIEESEQELIKLAKKMKKNNTSVDFVLLGEITSSNERKLEQFNIEVRTGDGSHMVTAAPSRQLLSEALVGSPIMRRDRGGGASSGAGAGASGSADVGGSSTEDFPFGIDPTVDPELALALRMSMEEEKARQEKIAREEAEKAKAASGLETVEEEGESAALLDKDGQPSGSKKDEDKGDKPDDADKMDTS
ncbi:putative multiubiquitin chain binding protein [Apodospora peruviana]|uniref:Multiubiquitin chain binding protein n=1 Tax=Apodospora peruviana TaxID=516989 RepID=A0AAE0MFQ8_9PEZI|nr:putative multiubiquitin chain binding protein [Apodospora peruviana]